MEPLERGEQLYNHKLLKRAYYLRGVPEKVCSCPNPLQPNCRQVIAERDLQSCQHCQIPPLLVCRFLTTNRRPMLPRDEWQDTKNYRQKLILCIFAMFFFMISRVCVFLKCELFIIIHISIVDYGASLYHCL